jgi:hypothetical protein
VWKKTHEIPVGIRVKGHGVVGKVRSATLVFVVSRLAYLCRKLPVPLYTVYTVYVDKLKPSADSVSKILHMTKKMLAFVMEFCS